MKRVISLLRMPLQFHMAGRLNRRQHFLVQLMVVLPFAAFMLFQIAMNVDFNNTAMYEKTIYFWLNGLIGLYWMSFAIKAGIARLHDCDRSGWWILLVMFLGGYLLLAVWPGSKGQNRYGDYVVIK